MRANLLKLAELYASAVGAWWAETPPQQPKGAALPMDFWIKFVQMSRRLGTDPRELAAVLWRESRFNPTSRNFASGKNAPPVAQGLSQFIHNTATRALGMSENTWRAFAWMPAEQQLQWIEKYFGSRAKGKDAGQLYLMNFGGFPNPDGSLYAGHAAQERWIAQHPEDADKFKNPNYQQKAIEQNKGLVTDDRIMPSSITRLVAGGIKGPIRAKIEEAMKIVDNQPLPPAQDPDPNWTPNSTMDSVEELKHQDQSSLEEEFQRLVRSLWY